MKEEMLIEVIKATITGEEHLGDNLKEQCIEYINNLQSQLKAKEEVIKEAREYVENRIVEDDYMLRTETEMVQGELLEILSKGENK